MALTHRTMLTAWVDFFSQRSVRVAVGLLISGISLYLALKDVNLAEVGRVLSRASVVLVLLALVSTLVNNLLKAYRWKILLGQSGNHISYHQVLMSSTVGQMLNALYPARAGELSRIYLVGEMGAERLFVAGTIVMEKVLDMLSYVLLIIWMLLWMPIPDWLNQSSWVFAVVTFVVISALLWAFIRRHQFLEWLEKTLRKFPIRVQESSIGHVQAGFSSLVVLENKRNLLLLALVTVLVWGFAVLTNVFSLQALDIRLPAGGAIILLIILQAGISLPAAPGKFGIFEYASVLALSIFGITQEELAFSFGLLLHAVVLTPVLIAGTIFLWNWGWKEKSMKKPSPPLDPGEKAR
jgi:glycosyltransferase 2 family protein